MVSLNQFVGRGLKWVEIPTNIKNIYVSHQGQLYHEAKTALRCEGKDSSSKPLKKVYYLV
mgnify:CR=1 FL=1